MKQQPNVDKTTIHDAPESYIGDMIKPIKIHFPLFSEIEDRIMNVICEKYEIDFSLMTRIKKYDLEAQSLEYDAFYKKVGTFFYMQPDMAYTVFIQEFEDLINS